MEVYIAIDHSNGDSFILGSWSAQDFSKAEVKALITEKYQEDYERTPEFGDHGIEIFTSRVSLK